MILFAFCPMSPCNMECLNISIQPHPKQKLHCIVGMTDGKKCTLHCTHMTNHFLPFDPLPCLRNLDMINEMCNYMQGDDINCPHCWPKWEINQELQNVLALDKFIAWLSHRKSGWALFSSGGWITHRQQKQSAPISEQLKMGNNDTSWIILQVPKLLWRKLKTAEWLSNNLP